ncbi:MAG: hypothetical protein WAV40_05055 [Microgenomates group bacterium]
MLKELKSLCNYGADIVYTGPVPVDVNVVNGVLHLNRRYKQPTDKKLAIFDNGIHGATALLDESEPMVQQWPGDTEKYYSEPQHISGVKVTANSNRGFTLNGTPLYNLVELS